MRTQFTISIINDLFVLLNDSDKGRSVTNDAAGVIQDLERAVPGGIGFRRVYYKDTSGRIDELKVLNGHFAGFAPCTESQQKMVMQMKKGGNCFICCKYDENFINGIFRDCSQYAADFIKNY